MTTSCWQEALWAKLVFVLGCAFLLPTGAASAEQVSVRHMEGLLHGFLALRTLEGVARRTSDWARLGQVLSRAGDVFSDGRARLGAGKTIPPVPGQIDHRISEAFRAGSSS